MNNAKVDLRERTKDFALSVVRIFSALPVALFILLISLMFEFNSFRRIGIIMLTIPLCVVGSVPGFSSFLSSAETDSPEIGGSAPEAAGAAEAGAVPELGQPLVVHVVNAGTGELNLYQGTEQIVARNPGLAQAIARLAASKG